MEEKDFINRRVEDVKTLFSLGVQDLKMLIIIICIGVILWLGHMVIDQNTKLNARIVEEVKEQVKLQSPQIIEREVEYRFQPIERAVDTTTNRINDFLKNKEK